MQRMSFLLIVCLTLVAFPPGRAQTEPAYRNAQLPVAQRVQDLLRRMTLEEKVAQLQSLWVAPRPSEFINERGEFAPSERVKAALAHGIGQISGPSLGMASDLENRTGPYQKKGPREHAIFTNQLQRYIIEHNRWGIPAIFHEEALHGLAARGATSFPQAIALASTWDVDLVHAVFSAAAREARARGAHQVLTPVLDLAREPRWGRIEETYGEDPYLVARMGVAAVRGFQGEGPNIDRQHVIATLKHFAAHGQPEGGTNAAPANFSERILREQFFFPFQTVVAEAKPLSVMASYNEIDGIPSHANRWLLGKILREEWGFRGFIVSDYSGINELITRHRVAADAAAAARKALEAGVDVELPQIQTFDTLVQQARNGTLPVELIDRAVARVLEAKFRLGLFENPYVDPDEAARVSESAAHRELALRAAREAIILLKNEGGLAPLDRNKIKTLAVIGPNAARVELGGYSGEPAYKTSILEGIKQKVGDSIKVLYAEGCKITAGAPQKGGEPSWWNDDVRLSDPQEDARKIAEAVEVAKAADIVLLVVGDNVETSREAWAENHLGDRDSLDLVGRQNDLVRAVVETGKPVVVFLINGRPLAINYIAERVPVIFEGWYLGQETGRAVADVLFGDYNPAGRLPVTIPRSIGQLPVYYYQKPTAKRGYLFASKEPLFPFGHGLSYTTFKYGNLRLSKDRIKPDEPVVVSVEVTNTGNRAGDEVVQLYVRDQVSSVTRPVKELKGFARISLQPGETRTVQFTLAPESLSFLNEEMRRVVEPGKFDIMVGPSSSDDKLQRIVLEVVSN